MKALKKLFCKKLFCKKQDNYLLSYAEHKDTEKVNIPYFFDTFNNSIYTTKGSSYHIKTLEDSLKRAKEICEDNLKIYLKTAPKYLVKYDPDTFEGTDFVVKQLKDLSDIKYDIKFENLYETLKYFPTRKEAEEWLEVHKKEVASYNS